MENAGKKEKIKKAHVVIPESKEQLLTTPPLAVVKAYEYIDKWSFNVFGLAEAATGRPLNYLVYLFFHRYGIILKYQINPATLTKFLVRIEDGYCCYNVPYHNNIHAVEVVQSIHFMLSQTGLMRWMSGLEIFATFFAAIIHDFEHQGLSNNFHVMTNSEMAVLYNDRSVNENSHICAAFRILGEGGCNILSTLPREEYREFRSLVIDMILATDLEIDEYVLKNMKDSLNTRQQRVEKSKALALMLHCSNISNYAKKWSLHFRMAMLLVDEHFSQGDKERELGLPISPMCDRNNTCVPRAQVVFIETVVAPSFRVLSKMVDCVLIDMTPEDHDNEMVDGILRRDYKVNIRKPWGIGIKENLERWKNLADAEEAEKQGSN